MRVAEQFIKQLQEGKTTEAITTLKSSLFESTSQMIEESKQEVIASYGFQINEGKKKDKMYEEDDKEMDDDESEDDESEDDDDSKEKEEE